MATDLYERLGGAVRRRREAIGLTQTVLANRIGLGRTSVTNIENGTQKILLHQFLDLARALHASPEDLLADTHTRDAVPVAASASTGQVESLLKRLDRRGGAR